MNDDVIRSRYRSNIHFLWMSRIRRPMKKFLLSLKMTYNLLPYVWRFRPWDFEYNYQLFVASLKLTRDHIEEHKNHTEWARDVAKLDVTIETWKRYEWNADAYARYERGEISADIVDSIEQGDWHAFHQLLEAHGQGWWD